MWEEAGGITQRNILQCIDLTMCATIIHVSTRLCSFVDDLVIAFTESKGFITEKVAKKSLKFVCPSQSENSFDFCQHA